MKIACANKQIVITLSPEEKTEFEKNCPGFNYVITWDDVRHCAWVKVAKQGDCGSRLSVISRKQLEYRLNWARGSLPHKGKHFPVFGTVGAKYNYKEGALQLTPPDEAQRPTVRRMHYKHSNGAVTTAAPVAQPTPTTNVIKVFDSIERIRHLRDQLNDLRNKHPNNISFKIKDGGTLGVEILFDD